MTLELTKESAEEPTHIGTPPLTSEELVFELESFLSLYEKRPVKDNHGGMSSTHLFLLWSVIRKLSPATIIESGVWRGQGTWLMEQAAPDAQIISIDIDYRNIVYRSPRVTYLDKDFSRNDWSHVDKPTTLVFFDDHVSAMERVRQCAKLGFKHLILEDNYAQPKLGDLYTLKMAFAGTGYRAPRGLRYWGGRLLNTRSDRTVPPNKDDAAELHRLLDVYAELPPIFLPAVNRWGLPASTIPTARPLLTRLEQDWQQTFLDEANWYTWMAYVRLK